jgi:hypothetical protein
MLPKVKACSSEHCICLKGLMLHSSFSIKLSFALEALYYINDGIYYTKSGINYTNSGIYYTNSGYITLAVVYIS